MSDSGLHSALKNTWEAAAPGWAKWEEAFSAGLEGVTNDLLDMAAVQDGLSDVSACGTD